MTTSTFRERIRSAIANPILQAALDANAERRKTGRQNSLATIPDWQERRQRAHAIRADVINHLDDYLDQFVRKVSANGFVIHRARDASQAINLITAIVKGSPKYIPGENWTPETNLGMPGKPNTRSPLVAKSKSMVSEEVNLNHALEAQGIRVVETDLGEYIVQLRGERPSHIITPAVHLRRQEVGQLFHEKLGIPYTEDIPTLTNTARKVLREVFLTADVGLSGVNFGVVDSGTLCIVTNEGNGRMVTTLPPIHIALMGMERLLPNLADLALFLTLLPRSATGQKLSVYTQLLHKPLAGQERHLIILDNGRSALRASSLAEALYCIRCGACLNACPIFREIGGHAYDSVYPGPIGSVISAGLFGSEFSPLAQASTLCGACKDACPVDIDLPKLLIRVRTGVTSPAVHPSEKQRMTRSLSLRSRISMKVFAQIARRPWLFALSQRFASLPTIFSGHENTWIRLPSFTGWGFSKD
jgi:L-lactate dehydrogenase complex protein LldF